MKPQGLVWLPVVIIVIALVTVGMVIYAVVTTPTTTNANSPVSVLKNRAVNGNANSSVNTNTGANTNSTTNANTASIPADLETYTNDELGITFQYPGSWGPTNVTLEPTSEINDGSEGIGARVDFIGTGETSFHGKVQLGYSSPDFAPGREVWFGEVVGRDSVDVGIKNLCNADQADNLAIWNLHRCSTEQIDGKWRANFYGQINSLDGGEVLHFVRVFAFETGNPEFPAAALSLFLTNVNEPALQTEDTEGIERVYTALSAKTADSATNLALRQFDQVLATFQFTE